MKILIIGGTRFIGLAVTRRLHAMGHQVAVCNRGQTAADLPDGVERITADTSRLADSADTLRAFAPDVVLHNIVLQESDVRIIHELLGGITSKLVMTSSVDVYLHYGRLIGKEPGPLLPEPADEESPLRSVWYPYRDEQMTPDHRLYHYDKIPAERAALDSPAMPGAVVRLPMVIGEQDWQRRLLPYIKPMQDNRPAIVYDAIHAAWRSAYAYVENAAHALALAALDPRANGRIYNVVDGVYSTLEMAEKVRAIMQWPGRLLSAPADQLPAGLRFEGAPQDLAVRGERIAQELGYTPPFAFDEGVRRAVAWEIAHPPAQLPPALADYSEQDEALRMLNVSA